MASGVERERTTTPVTQVLTQPVLEAAPGLLGYELVRRTPEGLMRARIVETEAYREDDPASHSFHGRTDRTEPMFAAAGHWYVYLCYGIHWMINVSCGEEGTGEAVLIRAAEPMEGKAQMEALRSTTGVELTNGPGKLAEALKVDDQFSGRSVEVDEFCLVVPDTPPEEAVYRSPRVGIQQAQDKLWRFYLDVPHRSEVPQNERRRWRN